MVKNKKSSRTELEKELDKLWGNKARGIIKSKMALNNINAIQLSEILTAAGRPSRPQGIRNLLSEGTFKASWYLHVLHLLDEYEKNQYGN